VRSPSPSTTAPSRKRRRALADFARGHKTREMD
jgi:hypothetical protein